MKRVIFLAIIFAVVSWGASAQLISTGTITTTKVHRYMEPVKPGYESSVRINECAVSRRPGIGVEYIGGYRFNPFIFLGAGVGIRYHFLDDEPEGDNLSVGIKEISIPVYLHLKTYFSKKRRCIPFFAMSLGYRTAPKKVLHLPAGDVKYNTGGLLINPELGLNIRLTLKTSLYFGLGLDGEAVPQLSDYDISSVSINYGTKGGCNVFLGFTF